MGAGGGAGFAACHASAAFLRSAASFRRLRTRQRQITDAGCATLAAALDSGALPALEELRLDYAPASAAATGAVSKALAKRK